MELYGAEENNKVRMTAYTVFPGIELIYNDIHTDLPLQQHNRDNILAVNHCHEGRIEYQNGAESFFLAPGDLSVSRTSDELTVAFLQGTTMVSQCRLILHVHQIVCPAFWRM